MQLKSKWYVEGDWTEIPCLGDPPYKKHDKQIAYWNSKTRFNVVSAGRRSGKTDLAKKKIVYNALLHCKPYRGEYFVAAPTRAQAKRIYWDDLKRLTKKFQIKEPNETELKLYLGNANIFITSMDRPERIEGHPLDGGILDEYGNMKENVWKNHVSPALNTLKREGWCDFLGVPEGRNHYFDMALNASDTLQRNWSFFTWFSSDILPKEIIEDAKNTLDPQTYQQEYEGSFGSIISDVYYAFSKDNIGQLSYDYTQPLHICYDFNVAPGVLVIFQQGILPNKDFGIKVIDEIWIENNSNTQKITQTFINKYSNHKQTVYVYGDASGGARHTSQIEGTDWDIVFSMLSSFRTVTCIPKSNPLEKVRINCVNSYLRTYSGIIRLFIDDKCRKLIQDFESVRYDFKGSIDKLSNKNITHMSDALGYGLCQQNNKLNSKVITLGRQYG